MASRRASEPEEPASRRRPATTPEGRENQMIALAVNLAEKQMLEGTASAQVISHYLKLGSSREQLEKERIQHENELMAVKKDAIANAANMETLFSEAIAAMRSYKGDSSDG
jgi:hypothetical protein